MALIGRSAPGPFRRLPYSEAIARYGSDKPDLRPGMEIKDVSAAFAESTFTRLQGRGRGRRRGPRLRRGWRCDAIPERSSTSSPNRPGQLGASGLVWARNAAGVIQSSALKAAGEETIRARARRAPAHQPGTCCC